MELQWKGAGLTPYSRMGDGRAVLRSSIREFLCSEAMAALGIPTSRALSVAGSDQGVMRETVETAAVVVRMAPSFVRFGSFEHWYYRKQPDELKMLADYVIDRFFPRCWSRSSRTPRCCRKSRAHGAHDGALAGVGFMHGVMNTDNMSILGLTLDYGPFGFMEASIPAISATTPTSKAATPTPTSRNRPLELLRTGAGAAAADRRSELAQARWTLPARVRRQDGTAAARQTGPEPCRNMPTQTARCSTPCSRDASQCRRFHPVLPPLSGVRAPIPAATSRARPVHRPRRSTPGPQLPRPPAHEAATMGARGRDESSQPQIRAAKLSGASGHRKAQNKDFPRWSACWPCCSARTTNSPNTSTMPPCRTGQAILKSAVLLKREISHEQ
jgi:hypothetical protein